MFKFIDNWLNPPKKTKEINVGKIEIHFELYSGEIIKRTVYGEYYDLGQFSCYDTAQNFADNLKKEFIKARKIRINSSQLLDTGEIKKITFDPQETYNITVEV